MSITQGIQFCTATKERGNQSKLRSDYVKDENVSGKHKEQAFSVGKQSQKDTVHR